MADARQMQALEFEARVERDERDRKYPNRLLGFYISNACLGLWCCVLVTLVVSAFALVYSALNYGRLGDIKNTVDDKRGSATVTAFCHPDVSTLRVSNRTADNAARYPFVIRDGKVVVRSDATNLTFTGCDGMLVRLVHDLNGAEGSGRRMEEQDSTAGDASYGMDSSTQTSCDGESDNCQSIWHGLVRDARNDFEGAKRGVEDTLSWATSPGTIRTAKYTFDAFKQGKLAYDDTRSFHLIRGTEAAVTAVHDSTIAYDGLKSMWEKRGTTSSSN